MNKIVIKPYNVIDNSDLPEISVDKIPSDGDPVEIKGELFFVCENKNESNPDSPAIGLIPLVVRNPAKVSNIDKYIRCLSIAHRKVKFKNEEGACDLENCDEMIIS
jgi:hypothetical protein